MLLHMHVSSLIRFLRSLGWDCGCSLQNQLRRQGDDLEAELTFSYNCLTTCCNCFSTSSVVENIT